MLFNEQSHVTRADRIVNSYTKMEKRTTKKDMEGRIERKDTKR